MVKSPIHHSPITFRLFAFLPAQLRFQSLAVARHGEAEQEVNRRHDHEHLEPERLPGGLDDRCLRGGEQIEDTDDRSSPAAAMP